MKALLTSAGFENSNISDTFLNLVKKDPKDIHVVFIPTAANTADSIAMLPKCMNDLLNIGIDKQHIMVYDLHFKLKYRTLSTYDAVYFCGGSAEYLIDRVNKTGFRKELLRYINRNGVYVGVSAGSCIAASNVKNALGLINATIHVHCDKGEQPGPVQRHTGAINLTNRQSVLINDGEISVIQ